MMALGDERSKKMHDDILKEGEADESDNRTEVEHAHGGDDPPKYV
jgi:hypothetical protein